MKKLKKFIVAVIVSISTCYPSPSQSFDVVYDPVVWLQEFIAYLIEVKEVGENTTSATNAVAQTGMQIEQLVNELLMFENQIKSLMNEAQSLSNQTTAISKYKEMLENWALQLEKLGSGDFWGFLDGISNDLHQFNVLLSETRGIIKETDGADSRYDEIYNTFGGETPLSTDEYIAKNKEWTQEQANTGYDAAKMMTLLKNSDVDMAHTAQAMQNIENATGDVGVLQGLAQLQAIQIKQNREILQLIASDVQINAINTATSAAEKDQSRKEAARFIDGHTYRVEVAPETNYTLQ